MSKARDLADFISTGSILSDGTIESTEINGVTADASELNVLDGITVTTEELNNVAGISTSVQTQLDGKQAIVAGVSDTEIGYLDGVTSNLQTQLDNISVTSGSLTKSFLSGETASITLAQAISPAPVVSVNKEVSQVGQSSKGAWDVNATASNYELHNTAYDTTLTPSVSYDYTSPSLVSETDANTSAQAGTAIGIHVKTDGTKYYMATTGANTYVYEYDLSTAFDADSQTLSYTLDVTANVGSLMAVRFSQDGTKMYVAGYADNAVKQYTLSSAWDLSTATYASKSFDASAQVQNTTGFDLSYDGTKLYVCDSNNSYDTVFQYTLSTPWDISTASYDSKSGSLGGASNYYSGISFSPNGLYMFASIDTNDSIAYYTLSTAWDVSTLSSATTYFSTGLSNANDVHVANGGAKVFYTGGLSNSNRVGVKTETNSTLNLTLGTGSFASTDVGKRIQGNGGDVTLTSTAGAYDTTGGSAFTDSSTIASGSWTMRGLKSAGDADGLTLVNLNNGFAFQNAAYDNETDFSPLNNLQEVYFKPDGTKLYHYGYSDLRQYSLTEAWNPAAGKTLDTTSPIELQGYDNTGTGIYFRPDGSVYYIVGQGSNTVYEFIPNTAWDLTAGQLPGDAKNVSSTGTQCNAIYFKPDGTRMFIAHESNNRISMWDMSTAWDIANASNVGWRDGFSTTYVNGLHGISFSEDGLTLYTLANGTDYVAAWPLTTAWNVATTVDKDNPQYSLYLPPESTDPRGLFIDESSGYVFISNNSPDEDLLRYSALDVIAPTSQYHIGITNSGGQIDTGFWTDINSMTADQAAGDGTVHYAVSTDDRTTWSVAKASDGVRPIVRDNAGTWQYNTAVTTVAGSVASASYDSVSAQFTVNQNAYEVHWRDSGNLLFVQDSANNQVVKYTASTPYDVTTLTQSQTYSYSGQEIYETCLYISPDGLHFYIAGSQNPGVHEYSFSTAYDLTTVSYDGKFLLAGSSAGTISFKPDGTRIYVGYYNTNAINTWPLTTAWDTSSYGTMQSLTPTEITRSTAIQFNADGTKMFVMDTSVDKIFRFNLTTAYDITTATKDEEFLYSAETTQAQGFAFNNDFTKMNISGSISGSYSTIYQYSSTQSSYTTSATWTNATTNGEFYALQQALGATEFNRMDKTQLDAVADSSHFTLGDTLDLAIALRQDTASASTPKSDGVSINYDAQALNQGAVLGTDYDYDFPDSTTVRVTSNAAQNLKIRVV